MTSSRGSSQPRDQTSSLRSPALAGVFFTTSTTWETKKIYKNILKDVYCENLLTWLWKLRYATICHLQAGDSEESVV